MVEVAEAKGEIEYPHCHRSDRGARMRSTTANPSLFLHFPILCALLLSIAGAPAQTQTPPADTPVGHWVAEHISHNGIGSWWDFRPDRTLTMHLGAIVT